MTAPSSGKPPSPAGGRRTFVVIGLDTFGAAVARELTGFGHDVIGIDIDEEKVSQHADDLAQAMILDARDEAALREAGVAEADKALVSIGEHLEASILAAISLKTMGVPVVWAKATSKTHHRILSKLNVDRVIHPDEEIGLHVAQALDNPRVRDYASLGNGFQILNFRVPETLDGTRLADFAAGHDGLRCLGLMRGTRFFDADDHDRALEENDMLILLGRRDDLRDFTETSG